MIVNTLQLKVQALQLALIKVCDPMSLHDLKVIRSLNSILISALWNCCKKVLLKKSFSLWILVAELKDEKQHDLYIFVSISCFVRTFLLLFNGVIIKGTVSWDRFQKCWRKVTDLTLNKGRGWFFNFSDSPLIFSWNKTSSFR